MVLGQALAPDGGPGARWGGEFVEPGPSMERTAGEMLTHAIEGGVHASLDDGEDHHQGNPVFGYYRQPGGGLVFNAGCTDWAYGLLDDPAVQQVTRNVLARMAS